MRKKILSILISCIFALSLVGCNERIAVNVNVENSNQLNNDVLGKKALIEIGDGLWYDSTTKIVYWWNGYLNYNNWATTPSPYYAPNGLPYRYNSEINTFEEIQSN